MIFCLEEWFINLLIHAYQYNILLRLFHHFSFHSCCSYWILVYFRFVSHFSIFRFVAFRSLLHIVYINTCDFLITQMVVLPNTCLVSWIGSQRLTFGYVWDFVRYLIILFLFISFLPHLLRVLLIERMILPGIMVVDKFVFCLFWRMVHKSYTLIF
jgi:hypothetical protein